MLRITAIIMLWVFSQFLRPVAHYNYPYGQARDRFNDQGLEEGEGGLYSFAVLAQKNLLLIPDATAQNIKIIDLANGRVSLLNIACPYDDIFVDKDWKIYFLSSAESMIYVYDKGGHELDSYFLPAAAQSDRLQIIDGKPLIQTDKGMWNIQTRKFETEYYDCELEGMHMDLFLVKNQEPQQLLSIDLQHLGAEEVYPYPGVEYLGRMGDSFLFQTYGVVFDQKPSQVLVIDSKGHLIQNITCPGDTFFSKRMSLVMNDTLYQVFFTPDGVQVYVYSR